MATTLAKVDNRAIGKFPWAAHKNFTDVSKTKSIKEAIQESALNFTVRTEPTYLKDGRPLRTKAIIREDTNEVISDGVGPDWTPVQNQVKFDWFDRYLEADQAQLLSAGYLGKGEKVCLIARLSHNTNVEIVKGDEIAKYMLLVDSFEPGKSMKITLLIARLRCGNGQIGFGDSNFQKIPHRKSIEVRMDDLHQDVLAWDNGFDSAIQSSKFLATKSVKSQKGLFDYYAKVMNFEEKLNEETGVKEYPTRSKNTMDQLNGLFEDDVYNGTGRSWWHALNSITAFTSHYAGRSVDTALDSAWFGQNALRQQKALKYALEFATNA